MVDIAAPVPTAFPSQLTRPTNVSDAPELKPSQQIEKLLWAEMLKYAGLEAAFTSSGGEGASAFARYMVEAIAEDIAKTHSLGFDVTRSQALPQETE